MRKSPPCALSTARRPPDEVRCPRRQRGGLRHDLASGPGGIPPPFYDLALSTDALLVTGNAKHFPEDKRIFTPSGYFRTLRPEAR